MKSTVFVNLFKFMFKYTTQAYTDNIYNIIVIACMIDLFDMGRFVYSIINYQMILIFIRGSWWMDKIL